MMRHTFVFACRSVAAGLLLGGTVLCLVGRTEAKSGTSLSGASVLSRCRAAYTGLRSYQGTSRVHTIFTRGGQQETYDTSAHVQFVRPSKIRVEGTIMGHGNFAYVSDGTHTWEKMNQRNWSKTSNTEMAIAGATGISQGAGTTIPAILLDTSWGYPGALSHPIQARGAVTLQTVNGHRTYRVLAKSQIGTETYWVDAKTFLLARYRSNRNIMGANMDSDQSFVQIKTNAAIPAATFKRPAGAP